MKKPIVSIIMPVYNAESYCAEAIQSVINQSYVDFELIIIDDGSTDRSLQIARGFAEKDNRIQIIHTENHGVSHARNVGLNKANGDWVQFVDSDDTIEDGMLRNFAEIASTKRGVGIIVSGVYKEFVSKNSTIKQHIKDLSLTQREEIAYYLKCMSSDECDLVLNYLWNRWIKKDLITNSGVHFNEDISLGEDFLFNCEVIQHCDWIELVSDVYYHYYLRNNQSLVSRFYDNELERRLTMYHCRISLYEAFGIAKDNKKINIEEGRYSWSSLSKINFHNCTLDKKDKIQYIRNFMNSDLRVCLYLYAKSKKGLKNYIKRIVLKSNKPELMYFIINKRKTSQWRPLKYDKYNQKV